MPDSFSRLESLPPLRITVDQLARLVDVLAEEMRGEGSVDVKYEVSMPDGSQFQRDGSQAFRIAVNAVEQRLTTVSVSLHAWSKAQDPAVARAIVKSVYLRLRDFGSEFHVSSSDVIWGKGAVGSIRASFRRYTPWFGPLLRFLPAVFGILLPLPALFILVALDHRRGEVAPVTAIVILSVMLLAGIGWLTIQTLRSRVLPHTAIFREERVRNWLLLRFVVGVAAFLADIAVLIALITK
jgi:hypothetical protein